MTDLIKKLSEEIAEQRGIIDKINTACENETRARNEDEKKSWKEAKAKIEELSEELRDLKEAEELRKQAIKDEEERKAALSAGGPTVEGDKKELKEINKNLSARNIIRGLFGEEKLDGAIAEMDAEAKAEMRSFGGSAKAGSISLPASLINAVREERATVDQANSAIQPTVVGAYVDSLRESAVYEKVGVTQYSDLTADYKIPAVGSQSLAWATAENSAAADGGAQFTSGTLQPTRLTGYVPLSNKILLQNGESAYNAVFRDLGRETANKIDAAMWSTANVTNAPGSIPATSGVGTFTEATYSANASILADFVSAEQTLADAQGLQGRLAYVGATNLMSDLKKSAQVASVLPAFAGMVIPRNGEANINGYPTYFTVAATKSAGTSGDFIFGDMSQIHLGFFGGISIIRDDINNVLNDQTNIVVHRYLDFLTVRAAAFVKGTSLVA